MAFNYSPKVITDGLVLYLDAANQYSYVSSSNTWRDISRAGANGTLTNGPTFSSANGGSIVFDGIDDYATTTRVPNMTTSSAEASITYEYWVQPTQNIFSSFTQTDINTAWFSPGSVNGLQQNINYKYYTGSGVNTQNTHCAFQFALGTNGFVAGVHQNSYAPPILVDYRTITGSVHLVVVKRTYNCSYYLNGVKMKDSLTISRIIGDGLGTIFDSNGTPSDSTNDITSPRSIYFGRFFKGNIFSYKLYLRELSATEVLQNYNATKTRFGL
jgi:hypothetical protein